MVSEKRSGTWGWIVGILVAVGVVWWIAAVWGDDKRVDRVTEQPVSNSNEGQTIENPPSTAMETTTETTTAPEETTTLPSTETVDFVITEDKELAENPDKYLGTTVAVEGEINEKVGTATFTVDTDGLVGGDEVLIIGKRQDGTTFEKGEKIRVVGKARKFKKDELANIENEIGYTLSEDALSGYEDKIFVFAESIGAPAH